MSDSKRSVHVKSTKGVKKCLNAIFYNFWQLYTMTSSPHTNPSLAVFLHFCYKSDRIIASQSINKSNGFFYNFTPWPLHLTPTRL